MGTHGRTAMDATRFKGPARSRLTSRGLQWARNLEGDGDGAGADPLAPRTLHTPVGPIREVEPRRRRRSSRSPDRREP